VPFHFGIASNNYDFGKNGISSFAKAPIFLVCIQSFPGPTYSQTSPSPEATVENKPLAAFLIV